MGNIRTKTLTLHHNQDFMYKSCTAIVLRVIKYNDKTNIVDVYSDMGRVSFAVSLSQSRNRNTNRMLFRPFSILDIEAVIRPTSKIQKIREARPATQLMSIPYNPYKQAMAFFLAEFLSYTMQNENEDELMFNYIRRSIEWLDMSREGYANFHLVFLIRISRFLGLRPDTSVYRNGYIFDMQNAVFRNTLPAHGNYLNPQESHALYQLMRMRYDNMHMFKMNREERNRCLEVILQYYSMHITDLSGMKSVEVLKELFD